MEDSPNHSDIRIGREEIIAFLDGSLDELSSKEFVERTKKDLFAAEALEGFQLIGATKSQALLADLDQRFDSRNGSSSRKTINPLYKLTAAAAVLLLGAFFVFQKVDFGTQENNMAVAAPAQERSIAEAREPEVQMAEEPAVLLSDEEADDGAIEEELTTEFTNTEVTQSARKTKAKREVPKEIAKPVLSEDELSNQAEVADLEYSNAEEVVDEVVAVASPIAKKKSAAVIIQKGIIRDLKGMPVGNATISEKGSQQTIKTNADGSFEIALNSAKASFEIIANGYLNQEIPAKPEQNLLVLMKPRSTSKAAEPEGGYASYQQYLSSNLRFPPDARDQEVSGQVLISFKVNNDGSLSSVKVKEKLFPSCDAEAIRLVKEGPKWEAALRKGSPTSSKQTISVLFK